MTADRPASTSPPVLTFIVPAYNMAHHLPTCLDSLLSQEKGDLEVIVVDDGSTDDTAQVVQSYQERHPHTVRLISQINKGHGGAVNTGLAATRGCYVKVVDADDWVDPNSLSLVLDQLRDQSRRTNPVDMVVTNYVYEKEGRKHKRIINFRSVMDPGQVLDWNHLRRFGLAQYMIMHALILRTEVLRQAHTCLPEHTYYVCSGRQV